MHFATNCGNPAPLITADRMDFAPLLRAGAAAVLCALQDALGEVPYNRTPVMMDMILNTLESRPLPFKPLKVHV